jgi:hypothetical protein
VNSLNGLIDKLDASQHRRVKTGFRQRRLVRHEAYLVRTSTPRAKLVISDGSGGQAIHIVSPDVSEDRVF